jgi:hypothetical protein
MAIEIQALRCNLAKGEYGGLVFPRGLRAKPSFIQFSFVVVLFFSGSALVRAELSPEELRAARKQWSELLTFKCTFVFREGTAKSFDGSLDRDPISTVNEVGYGIFYKRGNVLRQAIEFEGGPILIETQRKNGQLQPGAKIDATTTKVSSNSIANGRVGVRNAAKEEVRSVKLFLTYDKKWENFFDVATFMNRVDLIAKPGSEGCTPGERRMSPLNPIAGCFPRLPGELSIARGPVEYQVEYEPDGTAVLRGESKATVDGKTLVETYRAEWIFDYEFPMIRRVVFESTIGGKTTSAEGVLLDVRDLGTASMAARVITVIRQTSAPILVREWVSEDLGREQPTDDDFILEVPETTSVIGIKDAPPPGTKRKLDLSKIPVESVMLANRGAQPDFVKKAPNVESDAQPVDDGSASNISRNVVIGLNVVVAAICGYVFFRRRRQSPS